MRYVGREFSDVVRGIELKCPVYKTVEAGQRTEILYPISKWFRWKTILFSHPLS